MDPFYNAYSLCVHFNHTFFVHKAPKEGKIKQRRHPALSCPHHTATRYYISTFSRRTNTIQPQRKSPQIGRHYPKTYNTRTRRREHSTRNTRSGSTTTSSAAATNEEPVQRDESEDEDENDVPIQTMLNQFPKENVKMIKVLQDNVIEIRKEMTEQKTKTMSSWRELMAWSYVGPRRVGCFKISEIFDRFNLSDYV